MGYKVFKICNLLILLSTQVTKLAWLHLCISLTLFQVFTVFREITEFNLTRCVLERVVFLLLLNSENEIDYKRPKVRKAGKSCSYSRRWKFKKYSIFFKFYLLSDSLGNRTLTSKQNKYISEKLLKYRVCRILYPDLRFIFYKAFSSLLSDAGIFAG